MNKQELIEKYKELWNEHSPFYESVPYTSMVELFLKELKQLDESEKVKVPQCVHKYIQEAEKYNWDLQDLMKSIDDEDSEELQRWFYHECNQETLARAWLDGYEVEKEKRYKVVMPNISSTGGVLTRIEHNDSWIWIDTIGTIVEGRTHTRKEIEDAGFGWVFDCPGVEVEEVE